jgi:hypothetical protein
MKASLLTLLAYVFMSLLFFGDVFKPLWLLTSGSDRFGVPFWQALLIPGALLAAVLAAMASRYGAPILSAPVFIMVFASVSVLSIGAYAESIRRQKTDSIKPDAHMENSFFQSLQKAPNVDFQFFLHSAIMKGCVPYAWSYRELDFYRLEPNVAPNVLPFDWVERCQIRRTAR